MLLFMAWGRSQDKSSAIYQKSLMKRTEVVNLGLKARNEESRATERQRKEQKKKKLAKKKMLEEEERQEKIRK